MKASDWLAGLSPAAAIVECVQDAQGQPMSLVDDHIGTLDLGGAMPRLGIVEYIAISADGSQTRLADRTAFFDVKRFAEMKGGAYKARRIEGTRVRQDKVGGFTLNLFEEIEPGCFGGNPSITEYRYSASKDGKVTELSRTPIWEGPQNPADCNR